MRDNSAPPIIGCTNASYRYGKRGFALHAVNLSIPEGSFTVVLGPNGSGKSTLVRLLGGTLKPAHGDVQLRSDSMRAMSYKARCKAIAFLAQDEPQRVPFSVLEVVMMGRHPWQGLSPFDDASDLEIVRACMERVGVLNLSHRLVGSLSGGERQRVWIARALAQQPEILILDEPASHLDIAYQVSLWSFLEEANHQDGLTVVAVSHDLNFVPPTADLVVMVKEGRIVQAAPPLEALTAKSLSELYDLPLRAISDPATGRSLFVPAVT